MRLFLLTILIWGGFALPCFAQDHLFRLRVQEKSQLERLLEDEKDEDVKDRAEHEIVRDYLKTYYLNCSRQDHPTLPEEHLITLCTCTTSQINERFSNEQIIQMFQDPPAGRVQRDMATRAAFRSCMAAPIRDAVYDTCLTTGSVRSQIDRSYEVCGCMADGMKASLLGRIGEYIDAYLRYYKGEAIDPVDWYMSSKNFEYGTAEYFEKCVYWHVYGWGTRQR